MLVVPKNVETDGHASLKSLCFVSALIIKIKLESSYCVAGFCYLE